MTFFFFLCVLCCSATVASFIVQSRLRPVAGLRFTAGLGASSPELGRAVTTLSSSSLHLDVLSDAAPLSNEANVAIFIVGLIPFAWATVEFWRRIASGSSFGTGKDSVVIIGEDGDPSKSRGKRVLGDGALAVAYALFGIAALVIGLSVSSVLTAPPAPPPQFGQGELQVPPPPAPLVTMTDGGEGT